MKSSLLLMATYLVGAVLSDFFEIRSCLHPCQVSAALVEANIARDGGVGRPSVIEITLHTV